MGTKTVIYSVYDYDRRVFNYYQGVGDVPASGWMRRATPGTPIPERLCPHLPAGAVRIGTGAAPRGIIATTPTALSGLGGVGLLAGAGPTWTRHSTAIIVTAAVAAVAGVALWKGRRTRK